jgi:hypothetical protein
MKDKNNDNKRKLYDALSKDYELGSYEQFCTDIQDDTKRKKLYDATSEEYDYGDYDSFSNQLGFGKADAVVQSENPLTEQDKIRFSANMGQMKRRTEQMMDGFNERMETMREYHENAPLGGGQTAEGKMLFNPESGKLEKTYITPLGNRYTSKGLADMESFRYRQAADMSVGGQLRKANLRLQELKAKQAERASEVHKEWAEETENNKAPLAAILGAATYTPRQQSDKENRALSVAIRETEELIKNLEEQKDRENGVDVGFWRGFGRTMGDVRTWDFGMGDMRDAFTMMNADELKKENATEGEREAHDAMMGAIHEKQQAEERYSGNADFWNRAGVMTGYMPSFMLDFVLTGGGFNGLSSFSKGSTRLATKVISKETAEKMAQQGFKSYIKENGAKGLGRYASDWTIKALGTTADDLLVRAPLMANTVQAGKTTADIIDRKLGDVVVDENGNYDFSNDKTWGDAIWQSEANAIIENYSEMFGAHLDPVFTLGNMSKLANVLGAKRIGAVLSKADASALNGIMGQTHQMFNKMGVSDYVGEVSEEYYGQLWRTMLNLDDAYQQNPDGTRTNLFASGQFHGDIWGGMALSMGLMGAGKHTLSAANYTSMKHGVNKADAKVNELLGKEVWEPLKATLDLTTNENIGEVAELIAGDKDFTTNEKAAVLDYMERSLNLRGFNLASMAQSRGGNRNESVQQANDSYLDGYNIISSQEMNDAKNMYEYQRARVADLVDESMFAMIEEKPIAALEFVNGNEQWNDEDKVSVIDYINAKQVYNGMIQRVRDDIDGRIEQSNSMIDARVNRNTGMIQGATMKQDERKVYVISGKLVPYDDGSGVSVTDSDNSIIIRDSETGALEQVSPDAVLSLDESQDPNEQKELAEQAIVEQFAREAADKIDGKVTFNPGDAYTITGQDGSQMQVQVIANEDGIVDNGDGTVNVSDGVNIFPLAKETIQQQADAANLARVAQFEQQRTIENAERKQEMQEGERPQYALNDIVSLTDENGVTVRGNITADADADGKYEVFTEAPINGKRVNLFTRDELDNMLLEHNGVAFERPAENESNNGAENIPENDNNAPQNIPAMQRIPKDEQGNPLYEQADSDTAWDAIVEQTEGDEDMAQTVADGMVADKEEALKKLEKAKSKGGNSIAEKIASEKERKAAIDAAKQDLLAWQKIASTAKRRKMEADDERRRIADEAAALRKAEEEKLRAEREEAERIEREALNGVPDMMDDKPQDARARGYRRMNGHKIDRQEPVQALQGKEVSVKFSDDAIVGGRVAVIDANLLQPSHIQGVRNPLHFIDEAQPKERNDEASVLSARKIAGNIRPEEITSSVTAYTGAPTVNARGEAIQGNNRSDALRIMWENHPEQAALYKQYLKDHAEEFGLQAEDIEAMEHPVLVNMVDVDDAETIRLGQYVAQDTESGGVERIKPKNALQRMGAEMRSFANLLLRTSDDEMSFAGLVDSNGANVLKWMSQRGFITPTQYKSAFDSKGNLTPESKNDLRGIMYQSIFKDGSTRLEEMFNVLPVKAQKAILATAFRDYDSPNSERMVDEIQNSVRAYYALSQDKMFAEAKNFKEARTAVESWKRQYQMDDVTGESYLPADNFSNFVLHLAAMYKGESQSFIQNTFGKIYDLIQGTQEETLFEQPDNTPRTLVQAIKETFNLDYNGQQRSNVLVGDTATSQRGQQGSNGTLAPRERVENRNGTTDDTGRTESIGGQSEIESSLSQEEMLFSDDTDNQLSAKIARRIEVQEDDWIESGKYGDTYKQTIIVDGTHKVIKVDAPDTKGNYIGSAYEYDGQTFGDLLDVLNYIDASLSLANAVAVAEKETDTTPTEKQKEAGNYKKGHVQVGTFNITIENPKGSVRSGIDTEGNKWETIMQNTYGYIRGTEGVDGDHIDVFLSDDIDGWNGRRVFVVDQYNEDGSFDEHKVMLGFNETDDAEAAYFANYDSDWANNHKTVVTAVNLEDFEKWIESSHRKTKPFAEYKSVKTVEGQNAPQKNTQDNVPYTIAPAQYTTKRGKVLDMQIVKFGMELSKDEFRSANAFAKSLKGWYDAKQRGFLMRSEDDAKQLVDAVIPKEDAALSVTQSEDSENAVENTPQAGEDIFQMAERIAKEEEEKRRASKENARKAEEAGKEPVSLEHWKRMNGDARMAEAGKRPLTREEIESASTDEVLKANALDYLDGNQGMIQSISYLKVYEDVRYPNRTAAADSGATDSAQLDTPALGNEQRVDVRDRGQSGNSNARLDRETGEEGVPAEGGPLHADPSDARSDATGNGNGGSETLPVRESVLQPGDSRGDVHSGSSVRSGEGRNVGGRTGRKSSTTSRKNSKRGVQADTARNAKNDRGLDLNDPLDKELADALKEFDSVLDEFNRAGREELSMSLVGMNSRQMEVLPQLVSAGAKVGYAYIKKGAHNFAEWAKRMREALGSKLKDAGLGENEIDAFIKEMWKSKLPMDGEVHTVEEWAGIIGKVELRKKVGESLEEKRKAQRAAEPIPVKTCDRENIVETLPFLLPQQQDDVLKAETQFFDESHNDRDHAFGKGYMFTNGTGTGKTYTGLGIVKRFIKQGKGRILILTPSQTKVKDWIEDAANLDIELNDLDKTAKARKDDTTAITEKGEGAVITTYANFRQNKALLEDLFDLIVYDESHRLLENKGGVGTTGSMQHYKLSNRNEQFAFLRLQDINPTWNELNAKNEEFSTQRDAIIKRIEKESGTTNELTLGQRGELPPVFNGNWTQGMEQKFPELAKLRNECLSLDAKYAKEVKPELERQAKENVKHTKVVFLSATPFNTRENLDYVEGYIFSYPEKEKQDGYSTQSPRSQFYLEHFGAGYKWRYHRLESSGSNPEAVSKQEVEFSNYLQHTLQTMSGRIIDSPFDYSRDFPTVTLNKAEEFNNAMEELSRNKATSYAYHEVMGDYNYTSALFESMKVTQIIPRLKEHFARGRKAVIFHRRVESKNPLVPPFKTIFDVAVQSLKEEYDATKKAENKKEIARLRRKYAGILEWEQTLDLRMPREQLADAFGKNNVLFFSGKESKKIKDKAVEDLNNDASGKNVIVIQEDSGKEGISLHDTTGQHQRVLVTLALPQSPITALQIEGRIYRIGNKSNAIFEYPLLGLNTELMLFGQKFNQQVSTTENLALGSQARNLRESFARGVEEHSGNVDIDNQGVGGKEFDTPSHTETDAFDGTVLDYYTNQKLTGKRDSREGTDYYPTPEPLGFMMNQWGRIGEGESVLEPSAGHGAIARYVPRENPLTAIEPSQSLFSKLQIKAGGNGRKFENTVFEDYNVVNKHDVVLMNPPFGAGGRLAVDHVAKAFQHLEEGGRIVAIIPRGSTDKKFDKWYEEQKDAVLTAEIGLPDITFERAGTSVNCRVVVIDKVTNEILRQDAAFRAVHMDLSGDHYEKIEDFFEEIRNIDVPERTIDHKAKLKKKAAPTARELRTVKGINYVNLTEDGISVSGRGVWGGLEWKDKTGKALTDYLADQYRRFKSNYDYAVRDGRETQEAAYGEMKELACKLAGMTEDEMQRYIEKKSGDNMLYRSDELIESINEQFNEELQQQIDGTLPKGHIYQLGNPGNVLLGTGVPNLPIQLNSTRLIDKATRFGHNYGLEEIKDLVVALQSPIAVFAYGDKSKGQNIIVELSSNDKNFVVGMSLNPTVGGKTLEINSIRNVFPKDNAEWLNWITQEKLLYVDKERIQNLIDQQRTILADVDYLDLDSVTKIVESFENPSVERENLREGEGVYTDERLSYENDPAAKMQGKTRRTVKQQREFAERERQRMFERVKNLAKKLHLDNVDIITDTSTLDGKKQRAKGFYSKSTGKITIVIPNHTSTFDVEQTLLHEAVAHYGLRQLFGEHFDTFLDNVFNNADENICRRIVDMAAKNGWDFHKATEEYLASLAEDTEFENINASWWQQIKDFFLNMLHKIGFEDFRGVTLSDNELRYILWRSYENLAEPGRYRNILGEAADVAKQYELKVGNYAVSDPNHQTVAESDDALYRDGDSLRKRYDRKVRTPNKSRSVKWKENLLYRLKESYQDSMSALKALQDMISEETGNPIHSFENAYIAENRMSAENKSQAEIYERDFYKPLMKVIQKLIKSGASYEELKSYIIAKHGLERNEEFSKRDAEQDGDTWDGTIARDYSGLTELTGDKDNFTEAAQMIVDEFENKYSVSELWDKINAATKETLRKSYNSGLMSKSTYDKICGMFKYYVPLRGWDCEVASNEYEYMTSNRLMLSPTLKTAEGRTSLADDPLATIGFMAESSIVQGNRNLMKQKFLNFILNNPNDLVSVSEQWYVLDNATGEWEARNPVIPEDATGDEVASIVEQFEQEMESLGDNATKKKDGLKLSMHITKREGQEHVVRVKRAGKEYCLYINGNPRAAQAINGLTNPDVNDSSLYKAAKAVKNLMARAFTSMNPAFVVSNLSRDIIWAGTAVAIKENAAYTAKYNKNVTECLVKTQLPRLLVKYKNGRLDRNNDLERYFDEFIRNGGETGFTQLNTVEDYKRNIKRFVKEAEGKSSMTQKAWNGLWDSVEFLNRSAEDTTRFMVYMTSRQMGRDVAHSIYDAKEITVNFNKKGSGGLGASVMNFSYIFFNAAIQSVANFGKLMEKHPAKTTMALTLFSSAGFLVPMMNLAIQALLGGDDDDNSYWDLPEWVRRNNLVLYVPWSENGYMTLPLPHEMRPFYSMGEIAYSVLAGKENVEDGLSKAATGFSSMLPIDLTGNGGNVAVSLTPTIGQPFAQIIANTDYFGKPIYRKHTWNEMDPEWTKAYKSTAPWLVDGTRWLNEITGGNNVDKGWIDKPLLGKVSLNNPALIEHLFESYLGGVGKTLNKTQKTLEMLWNEDLREWRNVPVISSFYQTADERTTGSQVNREYYDAVDEMEGVQHSLSGYKNQVRMGNIEYAEKIDELINSEVFKRYALVKGYYNAIQKASNALKLIDPTQREEVETMIMNLKVEMLGKLEELETRK